MGKPEVALTRLKTPKGVGGFIYLISALILFIAFNLISFFILLLSLFDYRFLISLLLDFLIWGPWVPGGPMGPRGKCQCMDFNKDFKINLY